MTDKWKKFWFSEGKGNDNSHNLRPNDYDYSAVAKYLSKKLHITPTDNVLDVGCGNGQMIEQMMKYTKNISGIDYSPTMTVLAAGIIEKYNLNGVAKVLNAHNLSFFKDGTFDKSYSIGVVQYYDEVTQVRLAVSEMLRVIKKGGRILVGDIIDAKIIERGIDGFSSFLPNEIVPIGYQHKIVRSSFEPFRRYDLIIYK